MTLEAWLLFCATEVVLCLSPGPAVLLVISLSLGRGGRAGLHATLGILAVNALWFALSATSLAAILVASWQVFFVVKWVGAAYLVFLGVRMVIRGARATPGAGPEEPHGHRRAFARGVVIQGANPKTLLFFTALLPQFIDPAGPVGTQVMVLGASSVLIELTVLALYVATCHRVRRVVDTPRFAAPLERVGGVLLVGAGVGLAAIRRG
jgi:threonine/homoserine/homoserine lactone efflux protein